ncbi:hypothetical protein HMPREF7215_2528 [Pyramidobacter piscolens W5455]|uniref:Uncharacterized protein n=1 Tax=Pyramidobacter piscolens W5455 TaxID=352165 RepID=A0ABM9ZX35_9BACT|nr:hypothetical protein HMPREF7215_2528 [Pyramidobacter piscolens W5455]
MIAPLRKPREIFAKNFSAPAFYRLNCAALWFIIKQFHGN